MQFIMCFFYSIYALNCINYMVENR